MGHHWSIQARAGKKILENGRNWNDPPCPHRVAYPARNSGAQRNAGFRILILVHAHDAIRCARTKFVALSPVISIVVHRVKKGY